MPIKREKQPLDESFVSKPFVEPLPADEQWIAADDDPSQLITQLKKEEEAVRPFADRLFDYLWVLLPGIALYFVPITTGFLFGFGYVWLIFFISAIVALFVYLINWWRRATAVQAYWLGSILGPALILLTFGGEIAARAPFWARGVGAFLFVGALLQLGRLIYQHRKNVLLRTFAMLPLLLGVLLTVSNTIIQQNLSAQAFGEIAMTLSWLFMLINGIGIALFFLGKRNKVRWAGILTIVSAALLPFLFFVFQFFF